MSSESVAASLYWTAVGDALGLPYEGLSPMRAQKLLGPPTRYRLLVGQGMVSGDTDTAAALLGGILGASGQMPPSDWLAGICEGALAQVPTLSQRVSDAVQGKPSRTRSGFGPQRWPRNALFAGVVLAHGFRRMLPPY